MADKKPVPASGDPLPEIMKIADENRTAANSMNDEEREEAFNRGMQLIYGGAAGCLTTKAGGR